MATKYAEDTRVPIGRSKEQIYDVLDKNGCDQIIVSEDKQLDVIVVAFRYNVMLFRMKFPSPEQKSFSTEKKYEQEQKRIWRVIHMTIKMKIEIVNMGLSSMTDEFMPHMMLTDGSIMKEKLVPQITDMYSKGETPKLLGDVW